MMACFLIPMTIGIITTAAGRLFPKRLHAGWLNAMLWGAVAMLAVEHVAHGEVVPYPPFLTAGLAEVFPEMMSIGVPMAVLTVTAWAGMVAVAEGILARDAAGRTGSIVRRNTGYC
jgi:hypothetical protein